MWTLFILSCHFLPWDLEDHADMLSALVGPGKSPARGQALCVHNLQQALRRDT